MQSAPIAMTARRRPGQQTEESSALEATFFVASPLLKKRTSSRARAPASVLRPRDPWEWFRRCAACLSQQLRLLAGHRRSQRLRSGPDALARQVPRLQGLPGGRHARPPPAARGWARGGVGRRRRAARHQHLLHNARLRQSPAPVGSPLVEDRASGVRRGCAVNLPPDQFAEIDKAVKAFRALRGRRIGDGVDEVPAAGCERRCSMSSTTRSCATGARSGLASAPEPRARLRQGPGRLRCHCAYCIIPTVRGAAGRVPPLRS